MQIKSRRLLGKEGRDFLTAMTWTFVHAFVTANLQNRLQICVPHVRVVFTQLSPGGCQMSDLSPVNYNHITGSHPGHQLLGYIIMCQVTSDHSAQKSPVPDLYLKFLNSPFSVFMWGCVWPRVQSVTESVHWSRLTLLSPLQAKEN